MTNQPAPDAGTKPTPINFDLLTELSRKPHPLLNLDQDHRHECCPHDGEVFQEARNAHHLLDIAGIPQDRGYRSDLDARTYLAITALGELRERLARIENWHARESGPAGTVGDYCTECEQRWPCDTQRMAAGTYVDEEESARSSAQMNKSSVNEGKSTESPVAEDTGGCARPECGGACQERAERSGQAGQNLAEERLNGEPSGGESR